MPLNPGQPAWDTGGEGFRKASFTESATENKPPCLSISGPVEGTGLDMERRGKGEKAG
jgi:hypothetical protein